MGVRAEHFRALNADGLIAKGCAFGRAPNNTNVFWHNPSIPGSGAGERDAQQRTWGAGAWLDGMKRASSWQMISSRSRVLTEPAQRSKLKRNLLNGIGNGNESCVVIT